MKERHEREEKLALIRVVSGVATYGLAMLAMGGVIFREGAQRLQVEQSLLFHEGVDIDSTTPYLLVATGSVALAGLLLQQSGNQHLDRIADERK